MKKKILDVLIVILAVIFICSGLFVGVNLYMYHRQQQTFDEITSGFPEEETPPGIEWIEVPPVEIPETMPVAGLSLSKRQSVLLTSSLSGSASTGSAVYAPVAGEWCKWWNDGFAARQAVYLETAARNPDVVGWVRIEGTTLDYPVCQTPSDPEKYIHLDIDGNYSSYGTPFMDAVCKLTKPRSSLLISGHHMRNGSMFALLQNYTSVSYYYQHPFIQFDTLTEPGTYQVALVLKVDAQGLTSPWRDLLFPQSEQAFNNAYAVALQNRYYDTGVPLTYKDELLALVTCEYTTDNGRLMVIAKRVS